jgi:hypothetical protein
MTDIRRDRWVEALALATAIVATAAIAGCGGAGDSVDGGPRTDAGAATDASRARDAQPHETGAHDSGVTKEAAADVEAGPDCGSVPPSGKQLVATESPVSIVGLTTDGYAVYLDTNAQALNAVPPAGGSAMDLGKVTSQSGTTFIEGSVVLFLPKPADPVTGRAPLSAWTAASGSHVLSPTAFGYDSYYYTYDADSAGAQIAYLLSNMAGTSATLTLSSLDGTMQTPLVPEVDLTNYACPPILQFFGETLVATYCLLGSKNATIAAFAGPTFSQVTLATLKPTGGPMVSPDPTQTKLLVAGYSGLALYTLSGGSPVVVDATGTGGYFTAGGDIVYTTLAGALKRYVTSTATTLTLVTDQMKYLLALSPDGQWAQVAEHVNDNTGLSDLFLASTTTAGAATQVWGMPTAASLGFSTDSTFSVFGTNFPKIFGEIAFDVQASAVAGGAPAMVSQSLSSPVFTSGSRVLANDHVTRATGLADIESLDLAAASDSRTLVTQADPNFVWASHELTYSWNCKPGPSSGVWRMSAP